MNRSPPWATRLPALEYTWQRACSTVISTDAGSAQGTPRDAPPRATMTGPRCAWCAGLQEKERRTVNPQVCREKPTFTRESAVSTEKVDNRADGVLWRKTMKRAGLAQLNEKFTFW
jgi:hypothetical protein